MLKYIECTGKNEEEAIAAALRQLGLDRDEVSVEVLERARNGFLGFGSSPAKVKVTYEVSQEEAPVSPVEEIFAPAPQPKPAATPARPAEAAPKGPAKAEAPASPVPGAKPGDLEERIRAFLSGLLAHMGVEAAIHVSNVMVIDSDGKPTRIGYRVDAETGKKVRISKRNGKDI